MRRSYIGIIVIAALVVAPCVIVGALRIDPTPAKVLGVKDNPTYAFKDYTVSSKDGGQYVYRDRGDDRTLDYVLVNGRTIPIEASDAYWQVQFDRVLNLANKRSR